MKRRWMGKDLVFQMELARSGAPAGFNSRFNLANEISEKSIETQVRKFRRRATTVRIDMVRDRILAEESLMKAAELEESTKRVNMLAKLFKKKSAPTEKLPGFEGE